MVQLETKSQNQTARAYLDWEGQSELRHEYHNGEIVPMTGGTTNHNRLVLALYTALAGAINEELEIFVGDVKLWIPAANFYTYPDVMMIAGDLIYHENRRDTVENPCLIVEVLSASTRAYDQGDKFDAYRSLSSLREYILVDQYRYYVKQFVKNDQGQWVLTDLMGPDALLGFATVPVELSLQGLYQRVKFEPPTRANG